MPTTTTTYSFNKPVVGADEDDWGGYLNGNWDSVDDLLDGTTPVTGIDINSGTLDGVTIGGTTAGAGTFTTLTANTSITGTLATAAQPNITSVGSLTSLDVAGAITSDGLTVDTNTLHVDSTNNRVGLGTTSPSALLHLDASSDGRVARFGSGTSDTGGMYVTHNSGSTRSFELSADNILILDADRANGRASSRLQFNVDGSEHMRIDSSGNVGIGTSSPDRILSISGGASADSGMIRSEYNDTGYYREFGRNNSTGFFEIRRAQGGSATTDLSIDLGGNVGIGTSSPSTKLSVASSTNAGISVNDGTVNTILYNTSSANGTIGTTTNHSMTVYTNNAERMRIDSSGNVGIGSAASVTGLRFFDIYNTGSTSTDGSIIRFITQQVGNTSTTSADIYKRKNGEFTFANNDADSAAYTRFTLAGSEKMRIDSSGNVGIGTTSPTHRLDVLNDGGEQLRLLAWDQSASARANIDFWYLDGGGTPYNNAQISTLAAANAGNGNLVFSTRPTSGSLTERMRIDSSGNVGIGITNPAQLLHVQAGGTGNGTIRVGGGAGLEISHDNSGNTTQRIDSLYRTTSAGTNLQLRTGVLTVHTGTSSTERMRIDSSGNLLVGKTSTAFGSVGARLSSTDNHFTTNGGSVADFNRLTSNGSIVNFYKDGTTVGKIGCDGGAYIYIGSDSVQETYIGFNNNYVYPSDNTGAFKDNAIDLGNNSARYDDVYATNGTIQTSDRNEKQDIAELSDAEQRVAVAAKGLLRKFRWRDAVEEKGDEARTHFGIIAQDLQAAFAAEGLDAGDYAMFIHTTWTDEETGEERSRMGVRYSELLAFIIAAI